MNVRLNVFNFPLQNGKFSGHDKTGHLRRMSMKKSFSTGVNGLKDKVVGKLGGILKGDARAKNRKKRNMQVSEPVQQLSGSSAFQLPFRNDIN